MLHIISILAPDIHEAHAFRMGRYALGLIHIVANCIVWTAAAVLTQHLYDEHAFNSPFLLTYLGISLLALILPFRMWTEQTGFICGLSAPSFDSLDEQLQQAASYEEVVSTWYCCSQQMLDTSSSKAHSLWNHKKHLLAAFNLAPIMFLADWTFNSSLLTTSVASTTVLVSTQSVWVFLLAISFGIEHFTWFKLTATVLGVIGAALTTFGDVDDGNSAFVGDIIAIISAMSFAVYTVRVQIMCPQDEELYSMPLVLGYVGLICAVPLSPVALYVVWQQEDISWYILGLLLVKGMLDFVFAEYLLFRSIVLTNPTIASVGLGLTIPFAFFADWATGKDDWSLLHFLGALSVTIGFLMVNLEPDPQEETKKDLDSPKESKSSLEDFSSFSCI